MKIFKFGNSSQARLNTCRDEMKEIMEEALRTSTIDFGVPEDGGHRTAARQHILFLRKASSLDGYNKVSKHQSGDAVDIVPYVPALGGYTYEDHVVFQLAGHIKATAKRLGYRVRWGGDWDSDNDIEDQTFHDRVHFELVR